MRGAGGLVGVLVLLSEETPGFIAHALLGAMRDVEYRALSSSLRRQSLASSVFSSSRRCRTSQDSRVMKKSCVGVYERKPPVWACAAFTLRSFAIGITGRWA